MLLIHYLHIHKIDVKFETEKKEVEEGFCVVKKIKEFQSKNIYLIVMIDSDQSFCYQTT